MTRRASNRPIPITPKAWLTELKGIERFLAKAEKLSAAHGDEWVQSMLTYYKERRAVLKANPPPKARKAPK